MATNPRHANGNRRRKMRKRFIAMGLPCAICGRPIHYDEPSDSRHPLSFVIDEKNPVSRWKEFGYGSPAEAAADVDNVQPCHWICNAKKSARTMTEIQAGDTGKRNKTIVNLPDGDW